MRGTGQFPAERRELIQQCLDDGWSWSQIIQTHRISWDTLKRHFDGTQWSVVDGARLGAAVLHSMRPRK